MLPMSTGHPPGWVNPVNLRASAVLPAAPAWDATPTESFSTFADYLTLSLTYTRGAAGGAFDIQLQVSIYSVVGDVPAGAQEWQTESVYAGGLLAAGADTQSRLQREYETYQATAAAVESFEYGPIALNNNIARIRVTARESGVPGTPGTLQITGVLA